MPRGRPRKDAVLGEPTEQVVSPAPMEGAIEVKSVQPIRDSTGTAIYELIQSVERKFKGKWHFAFVRRDDVEIPSNGWKMVRIIDHDQFRFVNSSDEANRTTDNILCVRSPEHQKNATMHEEAARKRSNDLQRLERTPEGQALLMNKMNFFKGVKASALPDTA